MVDFFSSGWMNFIFHLTFGLFFINFKDNAKQKNHPLAMPTEKNLRHPEWLVILGALILLTFLGFSVREILSPFLALIGLVLLLYPLRSHGLVRSILSVALLLFAVWFVHKTINLLTPFIIALILAYFFDPVVDRLEKWYLPRTVGILLIVLVLLGILVSVGVFMIPRIFRELMELVKIVQHDYVPKLKSFFESTLWPFLSQYFNVDKIKGELTQELPQKVRFILENFVKGAIGITSGLSAVLGQLYNLILIPFVTFYLLRDFDRVSGWFQHWMHADNPTEKQRFLQKVNPILGAYIRGQLTVCIIVGTLTFLGLFLSGIPFALILGITAGILNLIPYLGLWISLALALWLGYSAPIRCFPC